MGRSDLGGAGRNGDLAVVGTTAVVAAGFVASSAFHTQFYNPVTCPDVSVKVVDLSDAAAPRGCAPGRHAGLHRRPRLGSTGAIRLNSPVVGIGAFPH